MNCGAPNNTTIVVGISDDLNSVAALRRAVDEAVRRGVSLTVAHVVDGAAGPPAVAEATRMMNAMLRRCVPPDLRADTRIRIERGEPAQMLAHLSARAELLVVGACSNSDRRGIYSGKIVQYLLVHSACPLRVCADHRRSHASDDAREGATAS